MNKRRLAQALKRRPKQPDALRADYYRLINNIILKDLRELLRARILPRLPEILSRLKKDAPIDDLDAEFDRVESDFFDVIWSKARIKQNVLRVAGNLEAYQRRQLNDKLRPSLGIDVVGNEPWLQEAIDNFTAENVNLIRSLAQSEIDSVSKVMASGAARGLTASELAKQMTERFDVDASRAGLIARDQLGKFYGKLDETRQTDLGITKYIWRTVNDNRVRPEHQERDGNPFEWKDPPVDGHPGEAINCRCYAEPDVSDILGDL